MDTDTTCTCSVASGRCARHAEMMEAIHYAWNNGDSGLMMCLWQYSDGYGAAGFVPDQGYDWSGIRDSSPAAVEAMYQVVAA